MGEFVGVVGPPASGKSSSYGNFPQLKIKGLNPKTTVIINVSGKPLPFKGWKKLYDPTKSIKDGGNYVSTHDWEKIVNVINYVSKNRPEITDIVLEDGQYVMAFEFMARAGETGYKKFSDIGVHFNAIRDAVSKARESLRVFTLWHPEQKEGALPKMKTVGVMIDSYLTLEGLFTVILYTKLSKTDDGIKYQFVTNNDGEVPARSPIGMFDEMYINNDLGYVADKINEYYE
jgi:hypothetical protein